MELLNYPPIPRNFWRMFIDIVQTGQLLVASRPVSESCTLLLCIPLGCAKGGPGSLRNCILTETCPMPEYVRSK